MFSKKVSKAVATRTIENMEVYGMGLSDSFEEAATRREAAAQLEEGYREQVEYKLSFYISQSAEIDTRDIWMHDHWTKMYTVSKYVAA